MSDKAKAWTRKNIEEVAEKIADKAIADFEDGRNSPTGVGCNSVLGSLALKKHELHHKLKWNSDLQNLLAFRDAQLDENKIVTRELSASAQSMSLATLNFENMISKYDDLKTNVEKNEEKEEAERGKQDKKIFWFDVRQWGIFAAILLMCVGTVWTTSRINSVDRENQGNTEVFMTMLVSKLANMTPEEVKEEYIKIKEKDKDEKNKEGGD